MEAPFLCAKKQAAQVFLNRLLLPCRLDAPSRLRAAFRSFGVGLLLHALLVALDHLLHHLAAYGTSLAGSEIAVVALLQTPS